MISSLVNNKINKILTFKFQLFGINYIDHRNGTFKLAKILLLKLIFLLIQHHMA
jgi:hypothetical protein